MDSNPLGITFGECKAQALEFLKTHPTHDTRFDHHVETCQTPGELILALRRISAQNPSAENLVRELREMEPFIKYYG